MNTEPHKLTAAERARRVFDPTACVPALVGIILLGVALGDMPYGYYTFLRLALCPIFAWLAYRSAVAGGNVLPWILGAAALLYNPIIRVHFPRETWEIINVISIILLVVAAVVASRKGINRR